MPEVTPRQSTRPARSIRPILGATVAACLMIGCGSSARADGPISRWISSWKGPTADPTSGTTTADAANPGLMSRWVSNDRNPFSSGRMGATSVLLGDRGWAKTKAAPDPVSQAEFDSAKKQFDAKNYAKAEELFGKLAKREVKLATPWGEKAQYYLAETQFLRKKYVAAQDSFEVLFQKYNGTEHIEQLVQRQFQIAQIWLATEDPKAKSMDWKSHFDGRQPLIDTNSYAIRALEHVRNNDPDGALADDAVMRMADHYHNMGDWDSAATFYDQLVAEHPKSEYKERALLSSVDARIRGYDGPEYDVAGLEAAERTIRAAATEFPDHPENAENLSKIHDQIQDAKAEREFVAGKFYVNARKPGAAEYQFGLVMHNWPNSKWAKLSKVEMDKVAKAPRKATLPSKIMTLPGAPDPSQSQGGLGGMMGGMGGMGGGGGGGGGLGGMGGAPY